MVGDIAVGGGVQSMLHIPQDTLDNPVPPINSNNNLDQTMDTTTTSTSRLIPMNVSLPSHTKGDLDNLGNASIPSKVATNVNASTTSTTKPLSNLQEPTFDDLERFITKSNASSQSNKDPAPSPHKMQWVSSKILHNKPNAKVSTKKAVSPVITEDEVKFITQNMQANITKAPPLKSKGTGVTSQSITNKDMGDFSDLIARGNASISKSNALIPMDVGLPSQNNPASKTLHNKPSATVSHDDDFIVAQGLTAFSSKRIATNNPVPSKETGTSQTSSAPVPIPSIIVKVNNLTSNISNTSLEIPVLSHNASEVD